MLSESFPEAAEPPATLESTMAGGEAAHVQKNHNIHVRAPADIAELESRASLMPPGGGVLYVCCSDERCEEFLEELSAVWSERNQESVG